jgi:hypothetical protein
MSDNFCIDVVSVPCFRCNPIISTCFFLFHKYIAATARHAYTTAQTLYRTDTFLLSFTVSEICVFFRSLFK